MTKFYYYYRSKNPLRLHLFFMSIEPVISLSSSTYAVKEPYFPEQQSVLNIPVLRQGDLSETALVTLNTKDGSANAGKDYNGFFRGEANTGIPAQSDRPLTNGIHSGLFCEEF